MIKKRHEAFTSSLVFIGAATIAGCSAAPTAGGSGQTSETTATIVAELMSVPPNVRCVQITASGPSYATVLKDVTPGGNATVDLGTVDPGSYYLYGSAYATSCANIYGDGGSNNQTWIADATSVFVASGEHARATLHFFPLGSLSVGVSFDSCADASSSSFCGNDAGFGFDAGVGFSDGAVVVGD